jgi:hypothetical protein
MHVLILPPSVVIPREAGPDVQAALGDGPRDGVVQEEGDDEGVGCGGAEDGVHDVCSAHKGRTRQVSPSTPQFMMSAWCTRRVGSSTLELMMSAQRTTQVTTFINTRVVDVCRAHKAG